MIKLSELLDELTASSGAFYSWSDDRCVQFAKNMFEFLDNLPVEDRMELASKINNHVGGSEDDE